MEENNGEIQLRNTIGKCISKCIVSTLWNRRYSNFKKGNIVLYLEVYFTVYSTVYCFVVCGIGDILIGKRVDGGGGGGEAALFNRNTEIRK